MQNQKTVSFLMVFGLKTPLITRKYDDQSFPHAQASIKIDSSQKPFAVSVICKQLRNCFKNKNTEPVSLTVRKQKIFWVDCWKQNQKRWLLNCKEEANSWTDIPCCHRRAKLAHSTHPSLYRLLDGHNAKK